MEHAPNARDRDLGGLAAKWMVFLIVVAATPKSFISFLFNCIANGFTLIIVSAILIYVFAYILPSHIRKHQNKKTFDSKRKIEECPICFDKSDDGIRLRNCGHNCCPTCLATYLRGVFKDISKYPIKCFEHNCDSVIDRNLAELLLTESELSIFDRFTKLKSIPEHNRIVCPNNQCNHIMTRDDEYMKIIPSTATPAKGTVEFVDRSRRPACKQCASPFYSVYRWRYWCNICGDSYCRQCLSYSATVAELGHDEKAINMCVACYTILFRRACSECNTGLCLNCQKRWHPNYACDVSNSRNQSQNELVADKKTKELFQKQGYRQCPGCGIMVSKTQGCNHMKHKNCSNPQGDATDGTTHFCYTCGDSLFRYVQEEDGTVHFPEGVFYPCRKAQENNGSGTAASSCLVM